MGQQGSQPLVTGQNQPQQATGGVNQTLQPYYVGGGPTATAYGSAISAESGNVQNFANQSNAPAFQDMFNKYMTTMNQQVGAQSSKIGESLGSRGALYSSANLGQQSDLRQKMMQDVANTGVQYQTTLEQERQSSEQIRQAGAGQVLTNQQMLAQGEWGSREAAMNRAYQDFLRTSDVPPFAAAGAATGSSMPGAATVAK